MVDRKGVAGEDQSQGCCHPQSLGFVEATRRQTDMALHQDADFSTGTLNSNRRAAASVLAIAGGSFFL